MPSHVIRTFVYEPESRNLTIRFQSGRKYMYLNVPAETFEEMKKAFSKGEFFNTYIRDRFEFVRIED